MPPKNRQKLKYCEQGCRNHFYNGNNELGVRQCWNLSSAKTVKRKKVHINQVPPWNQKPITTLNCFSQPQFVMVEPDVSQ